MIERQIRTRLRNEFTEPSWGYVTVTSNDGVVLLTGHVASYPYRKTAPQLANEVKDVRAVYNQIMVQEPKTLMKMMNQRTANYVLATRIRVRLGNAKEVELKKLRVVPDAGVVYLMGNVSRDEGDRAARAIARLKGIERIVKVFDYVE